MVSIDKVCDELLGGNDALAEWAHLRKNSDMFLKTMDEATQKAYGEIVNTIKNTNTYSGSAQEKFLKNNHADPWLVALARTRNATVVTHETPNPEIRNRVLIPNICKTFNITCINTFDMLRMMSAQFVLR